MCVDGHFTLAKDNCIGASCGFGDCLNSRSSYECVCHDGYTGDHCDVAYDEEDSPCSSNPCANNAMCEESDDGQTYKCICGAYFVGLYCEKKCKLIDTYKFNSQFKLFCYSGKTMQRKKKLF